MLIAHTMAQTSPQERADLVERWYAEHKAPLARYLLRLVGDEQQAADLLQDSFVRAYEALGRQPPPDNPGAWLYRIGANLAFNALRRRRRWRWLPLSGAEETPAFEASVDMAQSVRRCLAQLSDKEAEALLLYEYAGLSCQEIAALSGQQTEAVRKRIYRAKQRFHHLYQKEHLDEL